MLKSEAYLEPCQASKIKRFVKRVNALIPITIFTKHPLRCFTVQGSEYASENEYIWFKLSCIWNKKKKIKFVHCASYIIGVYQLNYFAFRTLRFLYLLKLI